MTRVLFDASQILRGLQPNRLTSGFLALLFCFFLAACDARIHSHGRTIDTTELDQLQIGESSRVDVVAILGRPSFEGAFGSGKIYYLNDVMIEPAGGKKRVAERSLFVLTFNDQQILTDIAIKDETTGNIVAHLDEKTPTPGDTYTVTEQLFSTLNRRAE